MIYETKGRAREYFELAANLYTGCEHGCRYCFGPDVAHRPDYEFFVPGAPRPGAIQELKKDAQRLAKKAERRHILLSFITDPYQPSEADWTLTRQAIQVLHSYTLFVAILTKAGSLATRDFDILTQWDLFGVSLTTLAPRTKLYWEPGVPSFNNRIDALQKAKANGIQTWASMEPVLDPEQSLELIRRSAEYVDVYKVGTLNYHASDAPINWKRFAGDVIELLDSLGKSYYIKKDLARYIGRPEGITVGQIPK